MIPNRLHVFKMRRLVFAGRFISYIGERRSNDKAKVVK